MKKIVSVLLLAVVLGMSVQAGTASASADQFPKVFKTQSFSIQK